MNTLDRQGSAAAVMLIICTLILSAAIVAAGRAPSAPAAQLERPAPVLIFATSAAIPTPLVVERYIVVTATAEAQPAAQEPVEAPPAAQAEPTAAYTVQSAPEPAQQPTVAGYVAHTTAGDRFIPDDATPVPPGSAYDGPFLAPADSTK